MISVLSPFISLKELIRGHAIPVFPAVFPNIRSNMSEQVLRLF